ncbi:hypothetical protein P7C70_g5486, partial [Phenoliferia sp. Uapishka_3]
MKAVLSKVCLATAISIALLQRAWRTVRSTALTMDGVDALFAIPSNFLAIFELDLWRGKAIVSIVLVSVLWALPLVTVFAPASLTTRQEHTENNISTNVPSFDAANLETDLHVALDDYPYGGPSSALRSIASSTILGGKPETSTSPCGNCSYTQVVYAPALSCTTPTFGGVEFDSFSWVGTTFSNSSWYPWGDANRCVNLGSPEEVVCPTYNGNFALRWVRLPYNYSPDALTFTTLLTQGYFNNSSFNMSIQATSCYLHNATYTILSDFTSSVASSTILDVILGQQYPFHRNESLNAKWPLKGAIKASANFEAVKDSVYQHWNGTASVDQEGRISSEPPFFIVTDSIQAHPLTVDVALSSLVTVRDSLTWVSDLPRALERTMENVTLSLVANGYTFGSNTTVTAIEIGSHTVFNYTPSSLWIPYSIGLALGALCCLNGLFALVRNGDEGRGGFRAFVWTTRDLTNRGGMVKGARIKYEQLEEERHGFRVVEDTSGGYELPARIPFISF